MNSECNNCKLPEKIAESGAFETDDIKFDEWRVHRRVQKVSISTDFQEVSACFNAHARTLKRHIHVTRIQHSTFNNVNENLQEKKEILIQVDYNENYTNKEQDQVRTLDRNHFACYYLKVDGVILNKNVAVTSQANDHSRSAAMNCWKKVLSYVREKYRLEESLILRFCRDGCSDSSAQDLSSFCYRDLSWSILSSGITTSAITGKGPWTVQEAPKSSESFVTSNPAKIP